MTTDSTGRAADARHWRQGRRAALVLTALWAAATFVPTYFARELDFDWFGGPFSVWAAAQGVPILYVVLAWAYERRMNRLDREHRAGRAD